MRIALFLAITLLASGWSCAVEVPLDVKKSTLKFTGHAFLHDFDGEAKQFSGHAQVDPQAPELVRSAKIDIQVAKMTTFVDARDHNMFTWLQVEANPVISFQLTEVKLIKGNSGTAVKDHPAQFGVSGIFMLNKTPKPLEAQAIGWREGKFLVVTGTTKINTADHGLPEVRQLFLTVDKMVDVSFHLVFDLPPELQIAGHP